MSIIHNNRYSKRLKTNSSGLSKKRWGKWVCGKGSFPCGFFDE
jgi:hypothetical protein